MPAITSTSSRTASFCVSSFYRPTARPRRTSPPSACQRNNTAVLFTFGILNGLKSKVGLAAAKTAAMQINLNIDGCGVGKSLLLSTHPRAHLSSSPTSLLTTSPSPAPLNSATP